MTTITIQGTRYVPVLRPQPAATLPRTKLRFHHLSEHDTSHHHQRGAAA